MTFSLFSLLNNMSTRGCNPHSLLSSHPVCRKPQHSWEGHTLQPSLNWGRVSSHSRVIWSHAPCLTLLEGESLSSQINSMILPSPASFSPSSCLLWSPTPGGLPKFNEQIEPHDIDAFCFESLSNITLCLNSTKFGEKSKLPSPSSLACESSSRQADFVELTKDACLSVLYILILLVQHSQNTLVLVFYLKWQAQLPKANNSVNT